MKLIRKDLGPKQQQGVLCHTRSKCECMISLQIAKKRFSAAGTKCENFLNPKTTPRCAPSSVAGAQQAGGMQRLAWLAGHEQFASHRRAPRGAASI
eukprot:2889264-Pleurochrysis_carterae.AAC.2